MNLPIRRWRAPAIAALVQLVPIAPESIEVLAILAQVAARRIGASSPGRRAWTLHAGALLIVSASAAPAVTQAARNAVQSLVLTDEDGPRATWARGPSVNSISIQG